MHACGRVQRIQIILACQGGQCLEDKLHLCIDIFGHDLRASMPPHGTRGLQVAGVEIAVEHDDREHRQQRRQNDQQQPTAQGLTCARRRVRMVDVRCDTLPQRRRGNDKAGHDKAGLEDRNLPSRQRLILAQARETPDTSFCVIGNEIGIEMPSRQMSTPNASTMAPIRSINGSATPSSRSPCRVLTR